MHLTADPNQTLISGLSSNDPVFRYFAYSELCTLAEDNTPAGVARRTALFSDQKYSPTLWARLIRESLLLLGKDYQLFLRRGDPEVSPIVPVPPPTKPALVDSIHARSVPLLHRRIFKSDGDEGALGMNPGGLASAGPVPHAVELPEIFRSVEVKAVSQVKEEARKEVESAKGALTTMTKRLHELGLRVYRKYIPPVAAEHLEQCLRWWREDRVNKVAEKCLPSRELNVAIIEGESSKICLCHDPRSSNTDLQVISRLTCASLTEDRYGVVQRDIPRILEAFLSFLSTVEEYQIKVNSLHVAPKPDEKLTPREIQERETLRYEVEKAGEVLGALADGTFIILEMTQLIYQLINGNFLPFPFPSSPRFRSKRRGSAYCANVW